MTNRVDLSKARSSFKMQNFIESYFDISSMLKVRSQYGFRCVSERNQFMFTLSSLYLGFYPHCLTRKSFISNYGKINHSSLHSSIDQWYFSRSQLKLISKHLKNVIILPPQFSYFWKKLTKILLKY